MADVAEPPAIRAAVLNAVKAELFALGIWASGDLRFSQPAMSALRERVAERLRWYQERGYGRS